jgi:hypothetical protein
MTDKRKETEGKKDTKGQRKEDRINETQKRTRRNLLIWKFLILGRHVSSRTYTKRA